MAKSNPSLPGRRLFRSRSGDQDAGLNPWPLGKLVEKSPLQAISPPPGQLSKLAKRIHALRRDRAQYLEPEIFADPGWDILLSLYVAKREQRPVTDATVCDECSVPPSIVVRWLRSLVELRLVRSKKEPQGERSWQIELTDEGTRRMEAFLTDASMTLNFAS